MFVARSHIYTGFIDKVSTLTHFPLEPGYENYSFSDQVVKDFEHGFDSTLTESVKTPELDASFDEADTMPSSFSPGFLHLVSTICNISKLQLTPTIKPHELWYQARALLFPVPQVGKIVSLLS